MEQQDELQVNEHDVTVEQEEMESEEQSQISELTLLRQIVFGEAQADLEYQLETLRQEMQAGFEQLTQTLQQQMEQMQAALEDNVHQLEDRIAGVDQQYEEKTASLDDTTNKLADEIEMTDANSNKQDEALHKRLDKEVQQLSDEFTHKHNHTLDLLNQVKKELTSSKTDRKTLANLLASMASDLETEDHG